MPRYESVEAASMMLLLVEMMAAPGKRDELVNSVHALLGSGPDGLLQYTVGTSQVDSNAVTIVQEWQDAETQAAFIRGDTFASFRTATAALYAAPPSGRQFDIHVPAAAEEAPTVISLL